MAGAGARAGLADRVASAAVQVHEPKPPSLVQLIKDQTEQVALALPTHLKHNAEAYVRAAITLVKQNPSLAKCDPLTILGGLMTASQLGLELGPLGLAYLVPYGNAAQLQIGYKGYIQLGYRSGMVQDIMAESICENDEFTFDRATGDISHKWDLKRPRGASYAWYAVVNIKGGGRAFVILNRDEVEKYRKRSKQPNSPMWRDDFDAAAKKTCIRRLEPYIPKSVEMPLAQALTVDGSISRGLSADDIEMDRDSDILEVEALDDEPEQTADPDTGEIKTNALFGQEQ